jgi:hypothetical protein
MKAYPLFLPHTIKVECHCQADKILRRKIEEGAKKSNTIQK